MTIALKIGLAFDWYGLTRDAKKRTKISRSKQDTLHFKESPNRIAASTIDIL